MPRDNYAVGVPRAGRWVERLNSDAALYGGSGVGNWGGVDSVPISAHGRYHALMLHLPPLGMLVLPARGGTFEMNEAPAKTRRTSVARKVAPRKTAAAPAVEPTSVQPADGPDGRMRAVIEHVTPQVDGGRFAIKRCVGERVVVEADCFADGHDVVACALLWRRDGADDWNARADDAAGQRSLARRVQSSMRRAAIATRCAAWVDAFLSWRHDFERRVDADDIRIAALSGAALIAAAAQRARGGDDREQLSAWAKELSRAAQRARPARSTR